MTYKGETLSEFPDARARSRKVAAHLELQLECERPLAGPARYRLGDSVRVRRGPVRFARVEGDVVVEIQVPDAWMSSAHAEIRRDRDGWELVDLESKNGTFVRGERLQSARLADGDVVQLAHTFFRFRAELSASGSTVEVPRPCCEGAPPDMVSLSAGFAEVVTSALAVAPTRAPVLIVGESGTGKEILARTIHARSNRAGPFVAVNCGAIHGGLVESELFGFRKGSFSGAQQDQPGLVRSSDGGTLFLDEIGDLALGGQAALLRVLQESEVLPVGAVRPVAVDLRVLAATHRDLVTLVREGRFRHDLLARLDAVTLRLPPLRERREDVPVLIAALLQRLAPERADVKLAPAAARALLEHDWPLNVRELEQALVGALALSGVGTIEGSHLPRGLRDGPEEKLLDAELSPEDKRQRDELLALLAEHHGNLAAVARAVGKGRTQIVRWVQRYSLDVYRYRSR